MSASTPPERQGGFTLLEAIVALVVLTTVAMSLFAWLSSNTQAVGRVQGHAERLADLRTALAVVETINPMQEERGEREFDGIEISWVATPLAPRRPGRARSGVQAAFDLALYDVEATVRRDEAMVGQLHVRRAGWEMVRNPLLMEE